MVIKFYRDLFSVSYCDNLSLNCTYIPYPKPLLIIRKPTSQGHTGNVGLRMMRSDSKLPARVRTVQMYQSLSTSSGARTMRGSCAVNSLRDCIRRTFVRGLEVHVDEWPAKCPWCVSLLVPVVLI